MKSGTQMVYMKDEVTHKTGKKDLKDCEILKGYTVGQLMDDHKKLEEKYNSLETAHDELVIKFNALLAAYKANNVKVALQILEKEGN